jgi:hypothetical protein
MAIHFLKDNLDSALLMWERNINCQRTIKKRSAAIGRVLVVQNFIVSLALPITLEISITKK